MEKFGNLINAVMNINPEIVAARGTMVNIVHTSTCAASVLQFWLRNDWHTSTDTLCVVGLSASYVSGATTRSAIILLSLRQL